MFAIIAGLMTLLLVLAGLTCCFESSKAEKALAGLLAAPMLAFGNVQFSKGYLGGLLLAGLVAAALVAGGLPLLLSILLLWVVCTACWDDISEGEIPEVVVVEEYLDDTEVADDARRQLAKSLAREAVAKVRIRELEAEVERRDRKIAELEKPKPQEMLQSNEELQEIFGSYPIEPADTPYPQWVREPASA